MNTVSIRRVHPPRGRLLRAAGSAFLLTALVACGGGTEDAQEADPTVAVESADTADVTQDEATEGTAGGTTTTVAPDPEEGDGSEETSGDACDLFSDEVAADVLGVEIVHRMATGEAIGVTATCLKGSEPTGDPRTFSYVNVGVYTDGRAIFEQFSAEEGSQAVDGLGDGAVYLPDAGVLSILDGTDGIQVQVAKAGVPGTQEDVVTIARDVLDRLD